MGGSGAVPATLTVIGMSTQVHFRMADAGGRDDLARLVRLRDGAARRVAGEQPAKAGGRAGLGVTLRERRLRLPAPDRKSVV